MADLLYLIGFIGDQVLEDFTAEDFKDMPHLTIMPKFTIPDKKLELFKKALDYITPWFPSIHLHSISKSFFKTSSGIVPVMIVEDVNNESIVKELHYTVNDKLYELGGTYQKIDEVGSDYIPHVSWSIKEYYDPITSLKLVHHTEGFGRGIKILGNYYLHNI